MRQTCGVIGADWSGYQSVLDFIFVIVLPRNLIPYILTKLHASGMIILTDNDLVV